MGGELVIAVVVFLASAAAVWVLGAGLSKYGDALADLTGLGRLFVGSILVALATSLPELSTNISAVRLNPPNPDLAVGQRARRQHAGPVHLRYGRPAIRRAAFPETNCPGARLFDLAGGSDDRAGRGIWSVEAGRRATGRWAFHRCCCWWCM